MVHFALSIYKNPLEVRKFIILTDVLLINVLINDKLIIL